MVWDYVKGNLNLKQQVQRPQLAGSASQMNWKSSMRPQSAGPANQMDWKSFIATAPSRPDTRSSQRPSCAVDCVDARVYGKEVISGRRVAKEMVSAAGTGTAYAHTPYALSACAASRMRWGGAGANQNSRPAEEEDGEEVKKRRRAVSAARGLNTPVSHRQGLFDGVRSESLFHEKTLALLQAHAPCGMSVAHATEECYYVN